MARSDSKPRRRLNPDERRSAILEAAENAFATLPYSDVTLSLIGAASGSSNALVYRYFDGKEVLYAEVVRQSLEALRTKQDLATAALPQGAPARDQIREALIVYLDYIAGRPEAWAMPIRQPGMEPKIAAELRIQARGADVESLRKLLEPSQGLRHDYALWGYFGFVDSVCLRWVEHGCPTDARWPLIDSALGALEGALGDWSA